MYYDYERVKNLDCLFYFLVGERGSGKTYGFKQWAIDDYFETGSRFVYIRRDDNEIKKAARKFFDDIENQYPGYEFKFRINDNAYTFCIRPTPEEGEKIPWEPIGYGASISVGAKDKSISYYGVNKICFDEFIARKYLADEIDKFLNLYETISRMNDIPCYFLSNSLSVVNPYFDYFKVQLPYGKKTYTISKNGLIYTEFMKNEAYREAKRNTKFGRLIQGTDFEKYAVDNEFYLDNKTFIEKKPGSSKPIFNIYYLKNSYGIWFDKRSGKVYLSNDLGANVGEGALTGDDHAPNRYFYKNGKKIAWLNLFIRAYEDGFLYFENQNIKKAGIEILNFLR